MIRTNNSTDPNREVQLNCRILTFSIRCGFKYLCARRGVSMEQRIVELIEQDLRDAEVAGIQIPQESSELAKIS